MTRRGPAAWRALLDTGGAPSDAVRACAATLAQPMEPQQVIEALLAAGEIDLAGLLVQDEEFQALAGPALVEQMEWRIRQEQASSIQAAQARIAELSGRALRHGVKVPEAEILEFARRHRGEAVTRLAEVDRLVADAELEFRRSLEGKLAALPQPPGITDQAFEEWRASIVQALRLGALEAAAAAIEAGPTNDLPAAVEVPSPPVWPYRAEPIARVVEWFFKDAPAPPGFERYLPEPGDRPAWALLSALRSFEAAGHRTGGRALLEALAGVLACQVVRCNESGDGTLAFFDDLSAPGLHDLGLRRWPDGIPVWAPGPSGATPAALEQELRIQVGRGATAPGLGTLVIELNDVLAVLRNPAERRPRLLAQLGRQLPLDRVFDVLMVDESARWERHDVPAELTSADRPLLLTAAPGMGKSTLLRELARDVPATRLVDLPSDALPEAELILIDGADRLLPVDLTARVKDIIWARSTRSPTPRVIVAVRPETRARIETLARGLFASYELRPRSAAALREQARAMLGWVGIEAVVPGSYDRLAFLAGGNPTLLFHLCRSLARVLLQADARRRRFEPPHVEQAWEAPMFREAAREMLWKPLRTLDAEDKPPGIADLLRALVDFGEPGKPLGFDDLTWALKETAGEREQSWVEDRARLLHSYGLVRTTGEGVSLAPDGLGLLARSWVETTG